MKASNTSKRVSAGASPRTVGGEGRGLSLNTSLEYLSTGGSRKSGMRPMSPRSSPPQSSQKPPRIPAGTPASKQIVWDTVPEKGSLYWANHESEVFEPVIIVRDNDMELHDDEVTVEEYSTGMRKTCAVNSLLSSIPEGTQLESPPDDICTIVDDSEASVLWALKKRFMEKCMYTWAGAILLSVNPYRKMDTLNSSLYDEVTNNVFINDHAATVSNSPHILSVARRAYAALTSTSQRQTIVINGESGSGKSECAKACMNYFIAQAASTEQSQPPSPTKDHKLPSRERGRESAKILQEGMISVHQLLESFGNARTLRNSNASRFGKYTEFVFERRDDSVHMRDDTSASPLRLTSMKVMSSMLDKGRVVGLAQGERNFHIFYQLCDHFRQELGHPSQYKFLHVAGSSLGMMSPIGFDTMKIDHILVAMKQLALTEGLQDSTFSALKAILFLGNIEFVQGPDGKVAVGDESTYWIETAANMLDLPSVLHITEAFSVTRMTVRGQPFTKQNSLEEARGKRDVLCMEMYSRIFAKLVSKCNEWLAHMQIYHVPPLASIASPHSKHHEKIDSIIEKQSRSRSNSGSRSVADARDASINDSHTFSSDASASVCGVIDFPGYGVLNKNSLEQLCINYAAEKTHQWFLKPLLKDTAESYVHEGIGWQPRPYIDNIDVVQMIEGRATGLLARLNEEVLLPRGSDLSLLTKIEKDFKSRFSDRFVKDKSMAAEKFDIHHYGCTVRYQVTDFLQRNRNTLPEQLENVIKQSNNTTLRYLIGKDVDGANDYAVETLSSSSSSSSSQASRTTYAADAVAHIRNLSEDVIDSSSLHHVRCIKPNDTKSSNHYDCQTIMQQLRGSSIIQVIEMQKYGYHLSMTPGNFVKGCGMLAHEHRQRIQSSAPKAACSIIVNVILSAEKKLSKSETTASRHSVNPPIVVIGRHSVLISKRAEAIIETKKAEVMNTCAQMLQRAWRSFQRWKYASQLMHARDQLRKYIAEGEECNRCNVGALHGLEEHVKYCAGVGIADRDVSRARDLIVHLYNVVAVEAEAQRLVSVDIEDGDLMEAYEASSVCYERAKALGMYEVQSIKTLEYQRTSLQAQAKAVISLRRASSLGDVDALREALHLMATTRELHGPFSSEEEVTALSQLESLEDIDAHINRGWDIVEQYRKGVKKYVHDKTRESKNEEVEDDDDSHTADDGHNLADSVREICVVLNSVDKETMIKGTLSDLFFCILELVREVRQKELAEDWEDVMAPLRSLEEKSKTVAEKLPELSSSSRMRAERVHDCLLTETRNVRDVYAHRWLLPRISNRLKTGKIDYVASPEMVVNANDSTLLDDWVVMVEDMEQHYTSESSPIQICLQLSKRLAHARTALSDVDACWEDILSITDTVDQSVRTLRRKVLTDLISALSICSEDVPNICKSENSITFLDKYGGKFIESCIDNDTKIGEYLSGSMSEGNVGANDSIETICEAHESVAMIQSIREELSIIARMAAERYILDVFMMVVTTGNIDVDTEYMQTISPIQDGGYTDMLRKSAALTALLTTHAKDTQSITNMNEGDQESDMTPLGAYLADYVDVICTLRCAVCEKAWQDICTNNAIESTMRSLERYVHKYVRDVDKGGDSGDNRVHSNPAIENLINHLRNLHREIAGILLLAKEKFAVQMLTERMIDGVINVRLIETVQRRAQTQISSLQEAIKAAEELNLSEYSKTSDELLQMIQIAKLFVIHRAMAAEDDTARLSEAVSATYSYINESGRADSLPTILAQEILVLQFRAQFKMSEERLRDGLSYSYAKTFLTQMSAGAHEISSSLQYYSDGTSRLEEGVALARDLNLVEIVEESRASGVSEDKNFIPRFEDLVSTSEQIMQLRKCIQGGEWVSASDVMRRIMDMSPNVEMSTIQNELYESERVISSRIVVARCTDALEISPPTSADGTVDVSEMSISKLEEAIKICHAMHMHTLEAKDLFKAMLLISDLRKAMKSNDKTTMRELLQHADDIHIGEGYTNVCRKELLNAKAALVCQDVLASLQKGILLEPLNNDDDGTVHVEMIETSKLQFACSQAAESGMRRENTFIAKFQSLSESLLKLRREMSKVSGDAATLLQQLAESLHDFQQCLVGTNNDALISEYEAVIHTVAFDLQLVEHHHITCQLEASLLAGLSDGGLMKPVANQGEYEISGVNTKLLDLALEMVVTVPHQCSSVYRIPPRIKTLDAGAKSILTLRRCVLDRDWDAVSSQLDALSNASTSKYVLPEICNTEIEHTRYATDNFRFISEITRALATGKLENPHGSIHHHMLDTTGLDYLSLEKAINACRMSSLPPSERTQKLKALIETGEVAIKLRKLLSEDRQDWRAILVHTREHLGHYREYPVDATFLTELRLAASMAETSLACADMQAALSSGAPIGTPGHLDLRQVKISELHDICNNTEMNHAIASAEAVNLWEACREMKALRASILRVRDDHTDTATEARSSVSKHIQDILTMRDAKALPYAWPYIRDEVTLIAADAILIEFKDMLESSVEESCNIYERRFSEMSAAIRGHAHESGHTKTVTNQPLDQLITHAKQCEFGSNDLSFWISCGVLLSHIRELVDASDWDEVISVGTNTETANKLHGMPTASIEVQCAVREARNQKALSLLTDALDALTPMNESDCKSGVLDYEGNDRLHKALEYARAIEAAEVSTAVKSLIKFADSVSVLRHSMISRDVESTVSILAWIDLNVSDAPMSVLLEAENCRVLHTNWQLESDLQKAINCGKPIFSEDSVEIYEEDVENLQEVITLVEKIEHISEKLTGLLNVSKGLLTLRSALLSQSFTQIQHVYESLLVEYQAIFNTEICLDELQCVARYIADETSIRALLDALWDADENLNMQSDNAIDPNMSDQQRSRVSSYVSGDPNEFDASEVSTEELDSAIDLAKSTGTHSAKAQRLLLTAELIQSLRLHMKRNDWVAVRTLFSSMNVQDELGRKYDATVSREVAFIQMQLNIRQSTIDLANALSRAQRDLEKVVINAEECLMEDIPASPRQLRDVVLMNEKVQKELNSLLNIAYVVLQVRELKRKRRLIEAGALAMETLAQLQSEGYPANASDVTMELHIVAKAVYESDDVATLCSALRRAIKSGDMVLLDDAISRASHAHHVRHDLGFIRTLRKAILMRERYQTLLREVNGVERMYDLQAVIDVIGRGEEGVGARVCGEALHIARRRRDLLRRFEDDIEGLKEIYGGSLGGYEALTLVVEAGRRLALDDHPIVKEALTLLRVPDLMQCQLSIITSACRKNIDLFVTHSRELRHMYLLHESNPETFSLDRYPHLRTHTDYTLSVAYSRVDVDVPMLSHSYDRIPTSITRLPPALATAAVWMYVHCVRAIENAFDDGICVISALRKLASVGLGCPLLRDEIYLQLMKQISSNPCEAATERLWRTMLACLHFFPPSEVFESYFESFLLAHSLSNAEEAMYEKDNYGIALSIECSDKGTSTRSSVNTITSLSDRCIDSLHSIVYLKGYETSSKVDADYEHDLRNKLTTQSLSTWFEESQGFRETK